MLASDQQFILYAGKVADIGMSFGFVEVEGANLGCVASVALQGKEYCVLYDVFLFVEQRQQIR